MADIDAAKIAELRALCDKADASNEGEQWFLPQELPALLDALEGVTRERDVGARHLSRARELAHELTIACGDLKGQRDWASRHVARAREALSGILDILAGKVPSKQQTARIRAAQYWLNSPLSLDLTDWKQRAADAERERDEARAALERIVSDVPSCAFAGPDPTEPPACIRAGRPPCVFCTARAALAKLPARSR